jgi:GBP family porin
MKKSVFAVAVLSTVLGTAAGMASAQTNVTIYGIVDLGLDYNVGATGSAATGAASKLAMASGQTSGSRLGFKGSEDLGNGLSAIFTLEEGFNANDGSQGYSGRLFGRQSWVGLSGNLGSVTIGRQYSSTYLALQTLDPYKVNTAGDAQKVYGYGLGKSDPISRVDNSVVYQTQSIAGLSGMAGYGFSSATSTYYKSSTKFGGVNYVNGPLTVLASYQDTDRVSFAPPSTPTAALDAMVVASGLAPNSTTLATVKNSVVGGTYDFGVVKLHAGFGTTKAQAVGTLSIRNYLVGLTAPVGTGTLLSSWNRINVTNVSGGVANQFAIGYTYPLSKRTNFYAIAAYTENGDGVMMNSWANGKSDREMQAGMRHTF